MTPATKSDQSAIEAFLTKHITTSMFPLSNLRRYGMGGGHPRAMRFWSRWEAGAMTDLLCLSEEGVLFPQCPSSPWGDVKAAMAGQSVKGIFGDAGQVRALRNLLRLPTEAALDMEDPLYQLALRDLIVPELTGFDLRPIKDAPHDVVIGWRRAYLEEVFPIPGEDPAAQAIVDIDRYIAADSHRVLYEGGEPVAMTGFNAVLPDAVQVGGVYTPPDLRSRGLARRAVAMHLSEACTKGVIGAILFAATPQASKVYEAIGFVRAGTFSLLGYETPQVIYG